MNQSLNQTEAETDGIINLHNSAISLSINIIDMFRFQKSQGDETGENFRSVYEHVSEVSRMTDRKGEDSPFVTLIRSVDAYIEKKNAEGLYGNKDRDSILLLREVNTNYKDSLIMDFFPDWDRDLCAVLLNETWTYLDNFDDEMPDIDAYNELHNTRFSSDDDLEDFSRDYEKTLFETAAAFYEDKTELGNALYEDACRIHDAVRHYGFYIPGLYDHPEKLDPETLMKKTAYRNYLEDWFVSHENVSLESEYPVCYEEFLDNELAEPDIVYPLLKNENPALRKTYDKIMGLGKNKTERKTHRDSSDRIR